MNIDKIRSEFPHLKTNQLYFDHAAVSPLCNRSRKYIDRYLNIVQSEKINNFEDTLNLSDKVRKDFATLINTTQDRIATVKNTTDGLILLAQGIDWSVGDRVILYQMEFPSNVYPWYDLRHKGVKIDFISTPLGRVEPNDLESVVTDKTKVFAVSWVQYASGYKNNLKKLADWCHERGILFVVDAMQGLGAMELDVESIGIDFLSTGTAKWLLGPQGIGFIYITEKLQNEITSPYLGWHSRSDMMSFHDYDQPLKDDASRFEFATPFSLGIWAYAGAIEFMLESGPTKIEKNILKLIDSLVNQLSDTKFKVFSERKNHSAKSGIVVISHPDENNNEVIFNNLKENGVSISLRNKKLRISPHFYNTNKEIEDFVRILQYSVN